MADSAADQSNRDPRPSARVAPLDDPARRAALHQTGLLDSPPAAEFDRLTRLTARLLQAPVALISLIDATRVFFLSSHGLPPALAAARQVSPSGSLCELVVQTGRRQVFGNVRRSAVARRAVANAHLPITAYAGLPLVTAAGHIIGSLCVIDQTVRRWPPAEIDLLTDLAAIVMTEIDRLVAIRAAEQARLETEAARQRLAFLAEASRQLATSLDYDETLRRVAALAVPAVADGCTVAILMPDGLARAVAIERVDPRRAALMRQAWQEVPPSITAPGPFGEVLRTGRSVLLTDAPAAFQSAPLPPILHQMGNLSYMVVPLLANGRLLGAISFSTAESGRRLGEADLTLAEELAARAALAIENARLYREARETIRARDEFLSIAAHELRTPVTAVTGFTQLLVRDQARGWRDSSRLERAVGMINQASSRLARLTEELLDVSRLRLGNLPLAQEAIDLRDFVGRIAQQFAFQLDAHHRLDMALAADESWVTADPSRLEQVLINLLANAVKYSPEGGLIRLALGAERGGWSIRVTDQGIGLPVDATEQIFEPFSRAPNAIRRHVPGMGLGLYICRSIIERHDGRIWAESEGEGRGTTIVVWLPRRRADAQPRRRSVIRPRPPLSEPPAAEPLP